MSKVRLELRVNPSTKELIEKIKQENGFSSLNQAFEYLVRNYFDKIDAAASYFQMMNTEIQKTTKAEGDLNDYKEKHSLILEDLDRLKKNIGNWKKLIK